MLRGSRASTLVVKLVAAPAATIMLSDRAGRDVHHEGEQRYIENEGDDAVGKDGAADRPAAHGPLVFAMNGNAVVAAK
jgi:hypothetical protein